jgi:hypothetical protein
MRQGGGMPQTDAATLQQGLSGQQAQSELAFKAEIQLRQSESAVASPLTRPSQQPSTTTLVPGEIASPASPEVDAARTTLSGTNARAEHLAAAREAGFGQASSDAGADTGSPGYSAHGEGRDPLQQRTSPQLTFEPGVMNSKLTAEGGRSLKPAATLAAGQLEAVASPASPGASQPARSVALRIPNAEGGTASVVLTERAGQVQVTVRASDPALTQSLRSDLGSLAGSLEQHGFDVRVWNPSGASADREARSDSSQLSGQDDTRGQARQRHSPDDAEHRNRRQSQWSEDIE